MNSTGINSLMDHSEASLSSLQDKADTVFTNVDERKCQISQRPVQDTESQSQCRTQLKRQCQQCPQVFEDECHIIPEQSFVNVPWTVQGTVYEVHHHPGPGVQHQVRAAVRPRHGEDLHL